MPQRAKRQKICDSSGASLLCVGLKAQDSRNVVLSSYDPGKPIVTSSGSITQAPGFYVPSGSSFHAYIVASAAAASVLLSPLLSASENYIGIRPTNPS